jgi:segregation and condensation protein B
MPISYSGSMELSKIKKNMEAALFMSSGAISIDDLAKISNSTVQEARVGANELIHDYEGRDSAIELVDTKDGLKMSLKLEYEASVGHLASSPELNKGVMKTLAFISYKQPIRQSEVIKFRNNKGYDHIKVLEEKDFIRRQPAGRSYIIFTTKKFSDYFGQQMKANSEKKTV